MGAIERPRDAQRQVRRTTVKVGAIHTPTHVELQTTTAMTALRSLRSNEDFVEQRQKQAETAQVVRHSIDSI